MKTLNALLMAGLLAAAGIGFADAEDKPVSTAVNPSVTQAPAPIPPPPPGFMQQAPAGSPRSFQPANIDPEEVRASMKARAEFDSLNREIHARRMKLCEENPTIRKLQSNMRELQKRIDEILATDEELIRLKAEFETVSPQSPFGIDRQQPQLPPRPDAQAAPKE